MNRRTMIKTAGSALAVAAAGPHPLWAAYQSGSAPTGGPTDGPVFDPRKYGAKGDGVAMDQAAIQQTIEACVLAGGGVVRLGPGTYLSGTVLLKSNVTFEVAAGATLLGSPNPDDYYMPADAVAAIKPAYGRHLIFANHAQNITVRGPGTIDGNSSKYLVQVPRAPLSPEAQEIDVVAFGWKRTTGISPMLELVNVTNLRVENIRLQNAVGWTLRPIGCSRVLLQKVTIRNPIYTSNGDGIHPASCHDLLITDCDIVTGDDGICIQSDNPYGGQQDSLNVTVTNCRVSTCCNGLKVGVDGFKPLTNINFSNCTVYGTGPVNNWPVTGIDIEMNQNSSIEGVNFNNITMTKVRAPIFIRLQRRIGRLTSPLTGSIDNVHISNVTATGAIRPSLITGLAGLPLTNIYLNNIRISTDEKNAPAPVPGQPVVVKEAEAMFPGPFMFGRLPAYGFYARHVVNLDMKNIDVQSTQNDPRPVFLHDDTH